MLNGRLPTAPRGQRRRRALPTGHRGQPDAAACPPMPVEIARLMDGARSPPASVDRQG